MWIDTAPAPQLAGILGDFEADVLIVGGGIVDLSTAEHLLGSGLRVALVEARQLLGGVTGFTTGKLTILHGLIYKRLIDKFSQEKAKAYAEANQWSIDHVRQQVQLHKIDCAFVDEHAYTYTTSHINQEVIKQEVEAAQQLGLPATFEMPVNQPFPIAGAIRLAGQARFHPRQYLLDVARRFIEGGGRIFENVIAKDVHERDGKFEVLTSGGVISCSSLVIASHVPFYDNSSYYARLTQHRSYAIALKLNGELPDGMFINVEEPIRSMRRHTLDGEDVLIVGGEGHPVGTDEDTVERYMALVDWAYKNFSVNDVLYHWSTQDNETIDGRPYVGRSSKNHNHLYVATGFNGWGMSNGIAAGKLLADMIKGVANPWEALYDPNRGELKGLAKLMKQGFDVASHFVGDKLKRGEQSNLSPLEPGMGKLIDTDDGVIAAHRSEDGHLHEVSAKCTHMGCTVHWNTAEQTWDCPCHGSRFAPDGSVLHGPAVEPLPAVSSHEVL